MTSTTITVSVNDGDDETHAAAYFTLEDRFVTLKTADHKFVAAFPTSRVDRLLVNEAGA